MLKEHFKRLKPINIPGIINMSKTIELVITHSFNFLENRIPLY